MFSGNSTQRERSPGERWSLVGAIILLIGFYAGTRLTIVAGVVAMALGALFIFPHRSSNASAESDDRLRRVLYLLCCLFPLVTCAIQIARYYAGTQGVDFAIYAQLLHRLIHHGRLETSLFDLRYHHFLTHHFSPFLYLLGAGAWPLSSAPLMLIFAHGASLTLTLVGFYRLTGLPPGPSSAQRLLLLTLLILLPSFRIGMLWEVHDEIYALPLIVWALYAIEQSRVKLFMLMALALFLFKETLFLLVSMLALTAFLRHAPRPGAFSTIRVKMALLTLGLCGCAAFLLYTRVLPGWLFVPTFNGFQRLSSLSELLSPTLIQAKAYWICTIFFPLTPLLLPLLTSRQGRALLPIWGIYLLPLLPFFAPILLSNFPAMFNPYNYYSVVPATLAFCSLVIVRKSLPPSPATILLSLLCAALIGPRVKIPSELRDSMRKVPARTTIHQVIPPNSVVITGDYGASHFYEHRQMIRLYHANRNVTNFDYVALRREHPEKLSLFLRSWSTPCFKNREWIVRCALPSRRATSSSGHAPTE